MHKKYLFGILGGAIAVILQGTLSGVLNPLLAPLKLSY